MGDLCLTLLGPPEVRHADQVLLIYLAVEGGVHSRKKLSEQFWPEGDARHGRAALRITLLHLRHMLGEGTGVSPVSHLLIKRGTLGLDLTSAIELDLHILLEACTSARASTHTTLAMPNEDRGGTIDFTSAMEHGMVVRGFFPPSVREVIVARLDRLTPNAFALLVAGAVLDQGITFEYLCQVADLAEHDGLSALDEVLHSHLMHESEREGGGGGRYVFAHPKIRAVVYAEASEARRSIFHRRAVHVLQAAAAPAAVLAYHALAAGLAEPAFRWSLAAGDEAMRVIAVRDAITLYEQARHLLAEPVQSLSLEASLPVPEVEHLYTNLGRAYELNAEWEQARTVYTSMLAYAQDASQPVMESAALNRLAALAAQ